MPMSWFLRELRFHTVEDGVELLRAEYFDSPHLTLSALEVGRLLELDRETTVSVLDASVQSGFLERSADGEFVLASCYEGSPELAAGG
jgi:hypothetical protein